MSPRAKPSASFAFALDALLSAIQPTIIGPMIWPAAKTTVNALMPAGQSCADKLCRTKAVVDATTDKNTPPKTMPDSNTTGHALVNAGRIVAAPSKAFNVVFAAGQIIGPMMVGWIADSSASSANANDADGLARGLIFSAMALWLGALFASRQKALVHPP